MKKKWKWMGLFIAAITILSILSGCIGGEKETETKAPEKPSVITYGYTTSDIVTCWDPSDSYSNEIVAMNIFYEKLVRYDITKQKAVPELAEKWDVSSDGLVWTFYLRKGVKFHSGGELTAEDVKYSIDRTIQRGKGAAYIWDSVKQIDVVDKYTVRFTLSYPAPLDLIASAGYAAHIFSKDAVESHDQGDDGSKWFSEENECGTGPYKLESYSKSELVMTKFDDYWKGWEGKHFDKVIIKSVPESATARQMLEAGELDIVDDLPLEMIDALEKNPKIEIVRTPSFQNLMAFFNTEKAPLDNKLVRQALSYAFPYDDVINYVWKGNANQSRGPIPKGLWGHSDTLFQYSHDIQKAKDLLTHAGYPNGGFKLTLTYNSGDEPERKTAELFKAELTKLGIDLDIRGMPWDSQWSLAKATNPKDRQDIFVMYWWPDYMDPLSYLINLFHSEDEPFFNLCYYKNPTVDQMIDEALQTAGIDRAKATQLCYDVQKILVDDAPAIFIWDQIYTRAKQKTLKGYIDNPVYPHVVFFYDLYREE